ncbi:MAG: hypothetical protein R2690_11900 [Acidimicrobiales bacterium]
MRLIADGVVDRDGVTGLAAGSATHHRQLERLLVAEVSAGPLALARRPSEPRRRLLIEAASLSFADVAFGAGFASIRQFNDTVRAVFDATPPSCAASIGAHRRPATARPHRNWLPFRCRWRRHLVRPPRRHRRAGL